VFRGVLCVKSREAEGGETGLASVALAGGLILVVLETAGAAVEIAHPATVSRFQNIEADAQLAFVSQALSGWLYSFAWIGMAVLISATSVMALRSGFLPNWLGWVGLVAALVAVHKFVIPHASLALLWIVVVSVLMINGLAFSSTFGSRRLERSS
jgi:Domain of unknown function (DUF4386)